MPNYLIIKKDYTDAKLFSPLTEVLHCSGRLSHGCPIECFSLCSSLPDSRDLFQLAVDKICETGPQNIIVDAVDPRNLNPLQNKGWSSLIAMLILAFPEIRWTFGIVTGYPEQEVERKAWKSFRYKHSAQSIGSPQSNPIFDGSGLRNWILTQINQSIKGDGATKVPARRELAVILDEEDAYAKFLALMAYRNGFRVCAVESWSEAKDLLNPSDEEWDEFPLLSIEDIFLNFPDQGKDDHNSNLKTRAENLSVLTLRNDSSESESQGEASAPIHRRFVTVGHKKSIHRKPSTNVETPPGKLDESAVREDCWTELRKAESKYYERRLRRSQQINYKPATGLYTLWEEMGLNKHLWKKGGQLRKTAPQYEWPPQGSIGEIVDGHSAEGILKQIAEHLLGRAHKLLKDSTTVQESVFGAVLSTDALELLRCKTPTLSQDALSLKHQFEVMAECQFPGVEYHLLVKQRVKDIEGNLRRMGEWLRPCRKRDFQDNASAQILTKIITILEEHNEFEEAQFCRSRLRSLNNQIELRGAARRTKLGKFLVTLTIGTYTDWVLRSLTHFVATWLFLLVFFTATFALFLESHDLSMSFHQAIDSFLTIGVYKPSPNDPEPICHAWYVISYFAAATGALNIGLLVSLLYSRMSRE